MDFCGKLNVQWRVNQEITIKVLTILQTVTSWKMQESYNVIKDFFFLLLLPFYFGII